MPETGQQPGDFDLDEDRERPTPQPVAHPWRTLVRMGRPRPTRTNVVATLMALLLGFAIATQVRQNRDRDLETLRSDELVRILDAVQADNARLGTEAIDHPGHCARRGGIDAVTDEGEIAVVLDDDGIDPRLLVDFGVAPHRVDDPADRGGRTAASRSGQGRQVEDADDPGPVAGVRHGRHQLREK